VLSVSARHFRNGDARHSVPVAARVARPNPLIAARHFQKTSPSGSYDSELRPSALGGFFRWRFKDHPGDVVLAPDGFANVNRLEVVQTEFEPIRQLLGYESKLDANTDAGEIVDGAMVNGRAVNQDPRRMVSPGALRSPIFRLPIFHRMVRLLWVRSRELVSVETSAAGVVLARLLLEIR